MSKTLVEFFNEFKNEELERNKYWDKALTFHKIIAQYNDFIKDKGIKSLEIKHDETIVHLDNGLSFLWDPLDIRNPVTEKINNGSYEEKELLFFKKVITNCRIIFDIGANVGWYTCHLAKMLGKDVVIYAVEPVPSTFNSLQRNVVINKFKNVFPHNLGFSNKECFADFYIPEWSGYAAASMKPILDEKNQIVRCKLTTFDHFCYEHEIKVIDFIKCDVEGAELFVYEGGLETIKKFKPIIFSELLRKWSKKFGYHPNDVLKMLGSIGYNAYYHDAGKLRLIKSMSDECMETNFYFLHEEKHKVIKQQI